MRMRNFILNGLIMFATIALAVACGGPEEKKLKFFTKGKALYDKGEYVKAKLEFKNAVQIDPKYTDAIYMLGMIALKSNDPKGAYGNFSRVVELDPHHWDAQIHLGKFLLGAGQVDQAMEKAELVLREDGKNEEALILKGAVLLKKKDKDGARRFFESVIGRDVRAPDGYLLLASIHAEEGNLLAAERTLLEGIRVNGQSVPLHLTLAELYLKGKRSEDAIGLLNTVVAIEPDVGRHRLALAALHWNTGREDQAAEVLKAFVSAAPKEEERWIQASDFYLGKNKKSEAEQLLKEGIRQNHKSFKLRFALSALYMTTGRADQTLAVLEECLKLEKDPANPDVLHTKNSLAQFYLARQDVDKALAYVSEVLKESPKNIDANFIKGTISLKKRDGIQAVAAFRTVVNERPQFIPGHISLAEAHAVNNEMNLAFDTLQNALKIQPDSRDVVRAMARLYAIQKDFKNAESRYRKLLEREPKDLEVRADLGDLMMRAGDVRRAEGEYLEIKRLAPDHPLGYVKLSAAYRAQKRWDKAVNELEAAMKIQPENWSVINDLAVMLGDYGDGKKDLARALALAEKAQSLSPDNPNVMDTVGWIHYRRGDAARAIQWLAKAQAKVPNNPVFNYHLGMAYRMAGDPARAKEHLQIALSSGVVFPGREDAEAILAGRWN